MVQIASVGWGGGGATTYIWHRVGVRPGIRKVPFFWEEKYMTDPVFHHWYMNDPVFRHLCLKIHIFLLRYWYTSELKVRLVRRETGLSPPLKYFTNRPKAALLLRIIYDISVLFLLRFRAWLFICALWSPAGKGLTAWLSFVMCQVPIAILGQAWCLIVSIPDLCPFSYYNKFNMKWTWV